MTDPIFAAIERHRVAEAVLQSLAIRARVRAGLPGDPVRVLHQGAAVDRGKAGGGTNGGEGWGGESARCATRDKGVVSLGHGRILGLG
jgi:hypothetical protein